ncbi:hypothetical protein Ahy_A06g030832 isoform I [Arachis hypogaea]|uniref:Uncharacterized protein n=1 Tax=Arachis hypogaea TaxID=3818 RepID=A0A445CXI7_ARAHY|nr:hypothetical protein Ahy_A06g030832 isoform I [Arachis hypogaea]
MLPVIRNAAGVFLFGFLINPRDSSSHSSSEQPPQPLEHSSSRTATASPLASPPLGKSKNEAAASPQLLSTSTINSSSELL